MKRSGMTTKMSRINAEMISEDAEAEGLAHSALDLHIARCFVIRLRAVVHEVKQIMTVQ